MTILTIYGIGVVVFTIVHLFRSTGYEFLHHDFYIVVVAGIFTPFIYGIWYHLHQKNNAKKSIIKHLFQIKNDIDEKSDYQKIEYSTIFESKKSSIKYHVVFFNTDVYDSVLSSGRFLNFTHHDQMTFKHLYDTIKQHNDYLSYVQELEDKFELNKNHNDDYKFVITSYRIKLTAYEKIIKSTIDESYDFE